MAGETAVTLASSRGCRLGQGKWQVGYTVVKMPSLCVIAIQSQSDLMGPICTSFILFSLVAGQDAPRPKIDISKETTYVTGPLDKYGYIDYEAALNDRLGKDIAPENNANVLLWRALGPKPDGKHMPAEFFKRLRMDEPSADGSYFIDLDTLAKDRLKVPINEIMLLWRERLEASKQPWTEKEHPRIAEWLKINDKPLAIAMEATNRSDYFNPLVCERKDKEPSLLIGALIPGVQKCRELAAALTARAMFHLAEGKTDEAWHDLLACHRLARLVSRSATLIESLVGFAIEQVASNTDLAFLEHAKLTSAQIRERLRDLQILPPMRPVADKIDLGERFMYLDAVQLLHREGVKALGIDVATLTPEQIKALRIIKWEDMLRKGNRIYDQMAVAMRLKDRSHRQLAFDKIDEFFVEAKNSNDMDVVDFLKLLSGELPPDKLVTEKLGNILIGMVAPAARKVQDFFDRSQQVQRNLLVAFALAAYHADHGSYPLKLGDLAPKYLAAVPGDLFSGGPLIYRRSENGYIFYSVGINGKDDGGRFLGDEPPGDDLGARIPAAEAKPKK
jgi:hypothetical protein